jgi:hypothetical protein
MDQCIKAMGKYYIEREFGQLVDDDPFTSTGVTRSRPNPCPHIRKKIK